MAEEEVSPKYQISDELWKPGVLNLTLGKAM